MASKLTESLNLSLQAMKIERMHAEAIIYSTLNSRPNGLLGIEHEARGWCCIMASACEVIHSALRHVFV